MATVETKNKATDLKLISKLVGQYMKKIREALPIKSQSVIYDIKNNQKTHFIKIFKESKKSSNVVIVRELDTQLNECLTYAFIEINGEDICEKILERYDEKMEEVIEIIDLESELRSKHFDNKLECFEQLSHSKMSTNKTLFEAYKAELEELIEERLKDLIIYWKDQLIEKMTITEPLLKNATKHYREEINKCYQNTNFIATERLEKIHVEIKQNIIAKYKKTEGNKVSEKNVKLIENSLNVIFNEFKNKNNANTPTLKAIGIDLGTTNSCVAYFEPMELTGQVHVIENDLGKNMTPSVVSFEASGKNDFLLNEMVGQLAKDGTFGNHRNTIYSVKRLIGRRFDDKNVQNDMKLWPFKVIDDGSNNPKISIKFKGYSQTYEYTPEEISAIILKEMKDIASKKLGYEVRNAVITVPAYFNEAQKQATYRAGVTAGLNVLKIINEPTAAAIAFQWNRGDDRISRKVLIFDFGGGTLDVSILVIDNGKIEVLSHGGNTHLGGDDIDNNIITYCLEEFFDKTGLAIDDNTESDSIKKRLRTICEEKKCILSFKDTVDIIITGLSGSKNLSVTLTRDKFNELNNNIFEDSIECVKKLLSKANVHKQDIDDIVLVGGTTRIPRLQEKLSEFFDGKSLSKAINLDESVAIGAAIQAAIENGINAQNFGHLKVEDVVPLSLGVKIKDGYMSKIINCGTKIPHKYIKQYTTSSDFQKEILVEVFEGEEDIAVDNNKLGKFTLSKLPHEPKGVPLINVSFEINDMGKLDVKAKVDGSNEEGGIQILDHRGRLSDSELEKKYYST